MKLAPLERLVSLVTNRKVKNFQEACDVLDLAPKRVEKLLQEAKTKGYAIDLAGAVLGIKPSAPSNDITKIKVSAVDTEHKIAVCTDLHFGSKYHLRPQLEDFITRAYAEGVRQMFLGGDLLDGCYRHGRWELTHHGFDEQVDDFTEGLPELPGLNYYGITGNHDQTFENESGLVVHKAIEDRFKRYGRTDLVLSGARGGYFHLQSPGKRGVFVELWHPIKGPSYALTYGLQKKVEGYAPGAKPDLLFTGHWHQSTYCVLRGVHAFACGTFQGAGSAFSKALGGAPAIGGWIVTYGTTKEGTLRFVRPEWISYYEQEKPRKISLG